MKINLLPPEMQKRKGRYKRTLLGFLAVLCLLVPVIYYSHSLVKAVESLTNRHSAIEARALKLTALEALLKEKAGLEQELRRIEGEPMPEQVLLVKYLDEIARLLPDSLYVTELSIAESSVFIKGVTPSYALAAEFLRVLAGSSLFESPSLGFLKSDTGGHVFEIAVQIRRAKAQ